GLGAGRVVGDPRVDLSLVLDEGQLEPAGGAGVLRPCERGSGRHSEDQGEGDPANGGVRSGRVERPCMHGYSWRASFIPFTLQEKTSLVCFCSLIGVLRRGAARWRRERLPPPARVSYVRRS